MTLYNKFLLTASIVLIVALISAGIYLAVSPEYFRHAVSLIDKNMPPALFIALMVILPVVGFPISIFLIMGGIKFGIFYASLLWLIILPVHALIGYYLAGSLRIPLKRFFYKMGYPVPELPEKGVAPFSFLFLAIPGIPYGGKNYLLPLAGVPFSYCVLMNVAVQWPQGIPFIVLGRSIMDLDLTLFYIALAAIVLIYFFLRWLKRKYGNTQYSR